MKFKKFLANLFFFLFPYQAAVDAVNNGSSVDELDEIMLNAAGFKK